MLSSMLTTHFTPFHLKSSKEKDQCFYYNILNRRLIPQADLTHTHKLRVYRDKGNSSFFQNAYYNTYCK